MARICVSREPVSLRFPDGNYVELKYGSAIPYPDHIPVGVPTRLVSNDPDEFALAEAEAVLGGAKRVADAVESALYAARSAQAKATQAAQDAADQVQALQSALNAATVDLTTAQNAVDALKPAPTEAELAAEAEKVAQAIEAERAAIAAQVETLEAEAKAARDRLIALAQAPVEDPAPVVDETPVEPDPADIPAVPAPTKKRK